MTKISVREFSFRGHPYKAACHEDTPQNPSWFTFEDEADVRDRDWTIAPGDYVMDVGAAYGSYTLTALAAGAAFVWAWSPQWFSEAREEDLLLESLRLNGWSEKCKVFRSGIYDRTGWLHTVSQEFLTAPTEDPEVIRVESMKEWAAREKPARVDWLKLDVEGAEVEVLRNSEDLIQEFRPKIHLENHVFKRPNVVQEVKDLLVWAFGYKEVRTVPYHGVSHSLYHP